MEFKSSFKGFIGASLYRISPFISVNVIVYFIQDVPVIMWVVYVITALYCLYQFIETVFVYLQRVRINETSIKLLNLVGEIQMRWDDIRYATLRERSHSYSRTSRLLHLVDSGEHAIGYFTSALSEEDESTLLEFIKSKVPLVIQQDR